MKPIIKTTLLLLALLLPTTASAYDFCVDNIYYNIYGNNVSVTYKGSNYLQYKSYSGDVIIPATVSYGGKTYTVTQIGYSAFCECDEVTSITIPTTITEIGKYALSRCYSLETIYYNAISCADFIMVWGYDSLSVTTINIGDSVQRIPADFANFYLPKLTSVTIGNSVTEIGKNAFNRCKGLTNITLPGSVKIIDDGAFFECRGLTNINLSNSVTSIGASAFAFCTSLSSISLPNSVTYIGWQAFYGCCGLTNIEIPNSVTYIGDWAFENTSWLDNQPDGIVYAGFVAYEYKGTMPTGTSITLKEGTVGIAENAFGGCTNMIDITIPYSVTTIGKYAFEGCTGLTNVVLPNSIIFIGASAFRDCSELTSVTIPNSVTSIGNIAFYNCIGLKDVYSYITKPSDITMGNQVFYWRSNDYEDRILHIPIGTIDNYQADTNWSQFFGNIVEMEPELGHSGDVDGDGKVSIADVTSIINYLLSGNTTSITVDNADVDNDGKVSISDVTALINILLSSND